MKTLYSLLIACIILTSIKEVNGMANDENSGEPELLPSVLLVKPKDVEIRLLAKPDLSDEEHRNVLAGKLREENKVLRWGKDKEHIIIHIFNSNIDRNSYVNSYDMYLECTSLDKVGECYVGNKNPIEILENKEDKWKFTTTPGGKKTTVVDKSGRGKNVATFVSALLRPTAFTSFFGMLPKREQPRCDCSVM